jgi:hypothetical protein
MFTIAETIELLKKQRPEAELQSLRVVETGEGLQLAGYDSRGEPFRIGPDRKLRRGPLPPDFPP